MSKYIIIALAVLLTCSFITIGVLAHKYKNLSKTNSELTQEIDSKDEAMKELDINIALVKNQVAELESSCNEQLQARNDLIEFLNIDKKDPVDLSYKPLKSGGATGSTATLKESSNEIISKNKSDYAVDSVNRYWSMFLSQ